MAYVPNRRHAVIVQVRDAIEAGIGLTHATGSIVLDESPGADEVLEIDGTEYTFVNDLSGEDDEVRLYSDGTITGTLDPDIQGADYALLPDSRNDARQWYSPTTGYYIWWGGVNRWYIGDNQGANATALWYRQNASPVGEFTAVGEQGAATLALTQDDEVVRDNLLAAINAHATDPDTNETATGVWGTATVSGEDEDYAITLTHNVAGSAGNVAITTDGSFTVDGMDGGSDGYGILGTAIKCSVTAVDQTDGTADISIQVADFGGNAVAGKYVVRVWTSTTDGGAPSDQGTLTLVTGVELAETLEDADYDYLTDEDGLIELTLDADDDTYYCMAAINGAAYSGEVTITTA